MLVSMSALNFVSFASQISIIIGSDGIIPLVISSAVMYLFTAGLIDLMQKHDGMEFYDILRLHLGKFTAGALYMIYAVTMIYLYSYAVRIVCSQVSVYMMKDLPLQVIEILFVAVTIYASTQGPDALTNFASVTAIPVMFILAVLFFMCLKDMDILNMFPLFTHSGGQYLTGTLHFVSYNFSSAFALAFLWGKVKDKDCHKLKKDLGWVFIAVTAVFAAYYILTTGVLGTDTTARIVFPAINIMHNRTSSGIFLNRYEIIIVSVVIIMYFTYSALMLTSSLEAVSYVTGKIPSYIFTGALVTIFLYILNDRTGGEYLARLLHMKGYLSAVPVLFILLFFFMGRKKCIKR